jgi:predicted deacylase
MESGIRLAVVVAVSIAVGYLLSSVMSFRSEIASAASVHAPVEHAHGEEAAPLLSEPMETEVSEADPVAAVEPVPAPVIAPAPEPDPMPATMPVPVLRPIVAYMLEPDSQLAADHDIPLTGLDPLGEFDFQDLSLENEDQSLEPEYVAKLQGDGVDVSEGFDSLEPGTLNRMTWLAGESLYGSAIPTPVLVAEGVDSGPTVCMTGAVHGDELNGIETVRRLMYSIDPAKLNGRVIGVPIVNLQGFERHSRYLPDRRDLNRFFPGNERGSSASRIAHSFFEQVVRHCDALLDLHTGSFHRTNLPQLRANLLDESVLVLTEGFGGLVVLHSTGGSGTLRASAVAAGIPAVTLEAGEPLRVDDKAVGHSVKAIYTLLDNLGMVNRRSIWGSPEPTFYRSLWVRADKGGMLLGKVKLGKRVKPGDVLGTVTDPITNVQQDILAPYSGRVIGMALNQFVMPGYAAFHLGVEAVSLDDLESFPEEGGLDHSMAATDAPMQERDDSDE